MYVIDWPSERVSEQSKGQSVLDSSPIISLVLRVDQTINDDNYAHENGCSCLATVESVNTVIYIYIYIYIY